MTKSRRRDIHAYLALLDRVPETFKRSWDAIAIYDLEGRIMLGNAPARALVGPGAAELRGRHYMAHLSLDEETKAARAFAQCVTLGEVVEGSTVFRDGDGRSYPVQTRLVPARLDGEIVGVVGFARDGRARREVEEQFMRTEQQFRSLFENHPDGLALHDAAGRFLRVNASLERLTGYAVDDLIGQTPALLEPDTWGDGEPILSGVARGEAVAVERTIVTNGGSVREVHVLAVPLSDDGHVRGYCAITRDITDERRAAREAAEREKRLDSLAFGDALTGLPNRALLQDRLEQTLLFARRHRRSFAAHYIDIDHFKSINDTYGHQVGDAVLIAVAAWLRTMLRDSDTIGRIGGDEFVVLQPEIDSQRQAEDLAAKLCGIRDHPFSIGTREIVVTISVGCAVFPVDAESPIDMLRAADTALYDVKHRGRDGYAVGGI
jgi:diguanylate cyclase (GGDEF)-like protein/PAS domain S-box-containing protein